MNPSAKKTKINNNKNQTNTKMHKTPTFLTPIKNQAPKKKIKTLSKPEQRPQHNQIYGK